MTLEDVHLICLIQAAEASYDQKVLLHRRWTVDFAPSHFKKGSLFTQYGQKESLQQPVTLLVNTWVHQDCFKKKKT